jgi:hypothetical protein
MRIKGVNQFRQSFRNNRCSCCTTPVLCNNDHAEDATHSLRASTLVPTRTSTPCCLAPKYAGILIPLLHHTSARACPSHRKPRKSTTTSLGVPTTAAHVSPGVNPRPRSVCGWLCTHSLLPHSRLPPRDTASSIPKTTSWFK